MPAYYKVNIKGKDEGFIIYKTAIPKIEEVLKDQFLRKEEIINIELLFNSPENDDLLEPIADLFDEISSIGLSGCRVLRDETLEYYEITWAEIDALKALTNTIEKKLAKLKLLEDCLGGWQMGV